MKKKSQQNLDQYINRVHFSKYDMPMKKHSITF